MNIKPRPNIIIYKATGCEQCRNTGYQGRTVITEVLPITQAIRESVMKKETAEVIKQKARHEGMRTLRESGIQRVIAGESSLDEVCRITAVDQELKK